MIPFISHDDLGAYLNLTLDGTSLITKIALDGACEAVRREMHRTLNLVVDDEITLDGNSTGALMLPQRPVHEVIDVTIDGEVVDADVLDLDVERGILSFTDGETWWSQKGGIALTYTHGYALTEDDVTTTIERVPANIRLIALRLAADVYRSRGPSTAGGVTGEHIGTYSYTQDVANATSFASLSLTDKDRAELHSQSSVYAA